ncbi:MAG: GEVED domain-containing protein [Caldilineales bacterium]|nr:GEVED domain-containing protein [Caldilineales bacterium]MDW8317288.1 SdrD B-like domain-containing protein [Anaerolineae bacterium]
MTVSKMIENGLTTVPAGNSFRYLINYAYASTTEDGRNITLVDYLDPDLSWAAEDVQLQTTVHIASTSYDPGTGKVTFVFVDPLPAGSSGQLGILVRFPNGSTPNGTVADNTATIDGDNTEPATSNPVSITATASCRWIANITGPSSGTLGANLTYRARVDRPSPVEGNLNVLNGTLAVTLPVGVLPADIQDAGGGTVSGSGTAGDPVVVTWTIGAVPANGAAGMAVERTLVVRFDASRFSQGQTVTLTEAMALTVVGGESCAGSDSQNTTLQSFVPSPNGSAAKASSNATPRVGQSFYFELDADNTGNVPLDNFTIADELPQNFALSSIRLPGIVNGPGGNFIRVIYRRSDTGATEYTWPGSPFPGGSGAAGATLSVSALGLPAGVYVSYVRFEMGTVPVGFAIDHRLRLNGSLLQTGWGSPPRTIADGDQVCNTMAFTADYNSARAVNLSRQTCVTVYVPQVRPTAGKYRLSTIPNNVSSAQEVTWYVEVINATDSDLPMVDPMGMDLLPAGMDYVPGSFAEVTAANYDPARPNYNTAGAPAPTLLGVFPNYDGTGRTLIRWQYNHTFPPGTRATILFKTTFKPGASAGTHTNASYVSVVESAQGGPVTYSNAVTDSNDLDGDGSRTDRLSRATASVSLGSVRPEAWKYKHSATPASVPPGATIRWYAEVANNSAASFPMVNGMGMDLLPAWLEYVEGSFAAVDNTNSDPAVPNYNTAAAPPPTLLGIFPNYNGTGRTLIRWQYNHVFPPNTWATVTFLTRVKPGAPAGEIYNYSNVSVVEAIQPSVVVYERPIKDQLDLDGDGSTTDTISQFGAPFYVASAASLDSVKWVKGALDTDWSKYPASGQTSPGGQADYRLVVINSGNVPLRNLSITDILPIVGDRGVVTPDPRHTQWTPFLAGPVTAPAGVTVYYSTASNPCRNDMGDPDPYPAGCTPPAWSAVPPADITAVRSLRFDFGDIVLQGGDRLELSWAMRAPIDAPTGGEVAWNSFGVVATRNDNGLSLLPTEPIKVGIKVLPILPAGYGDRAWLDEDRDGVQDPSESGLNGVRVELYRDNGDGVADTAADMLVSFTLTSGDGRYLFSNLPAGDYYAVFFKPPVYAVSPADQGSDNSVDSDGAPTAVRGLPATITPITTLDAGEFDFTWDQGFYLPEAPVAAVGNYVWHDEDHNGLQDEPAANGLNGVTVRLYTADGALVGTRTTANDVSGNPGYYLFDGLAPGSYFLEFVPPADAVFTLQDQGSDDAADSDANPANGRTTVFTLAPYQYDPTRDAGVQLPAGRMSLGNQVWIDVNDNGLYEPGAGETGVDGVRLNLYRDTDNNGVYTPGTDQFFATTTTVTRVGVAGRYLFDSLPVGNFVVQIDPTNFAAGGPLANCSSVAGPGPAPDPDNDVDHDNNGAAVNGYGVVSAAVSLTLNGEPITDGDDDPNSNLTVDFGFICWDLGDLPTPYPTLLSSNGARHAVLPGAPRLGAVAPDVEPDGQPTAAANGDDVNGVDDEDGVTFLTPLMPGRAANIRVVVTDPDGTACLSALIDFDGNGVLDPVSYTAINGAPAGGTVGDLSLSSGTYILTISVPPATVGVTPARFRVTDACNEGGNSPTGAALNGEVEDYVLAQLGDRVWSDLDGDGQQDGDEPGVPGVLVRLLDGSGNPVVDANGTPVVTTTDANGNYSFPGLPPGSYAVEFAPPPGYIFTAPNVGPDATDSDADQATGRSSPVSLGPGQVDTTVDAGLMATAGKVAIGNVVFCDVNGNGIFDPGDSGQSGVTVRLYRLGPDNTPYTEDDVLVGTTTTNALGYYLFMPLSPGQYYVAVLTSTVPATCGTKSSFGGGGNPDLDDHDEPGGDDGVAGRKPGEVVTDVLDAQPGLQTTRDSGNPAGIDDRSAYMTVDFGFTNDPTVLRLSGLSARPVTVVEQLVEWLRGLMRR